MRLLVHQVRTAAAAGTRYCSPQYQMQQTDLEELEQQCPYDKLPPADVKGHGEQRFRSSNQDRNQTEESVRDQMTVNGY